MYVHLYVNSVLCVYHVTVKIQIKEGGRSRPKRGFASGPTNTCSYLYWSHTVLCGFGWCLVVPAAEPSCWSHSTGTRCCTSSRRCRTLRGLTCTDKLSLRAACPPGVCNPARPRKAGHPYCRMALPLPGRTPGSSCSCPVRSREGSWGSDRYSHCTASDTWQ